MDAYIISSETALRTQSSGSSLASTLYGPVSLYLTGELGAGKTTFLQGFGHALGISEWMASPTYALEQRYPTSKGELLHLDLYRLSEKDARRLLASSDDHPGIRCIEWAERAQVDAKAPGIHLHLRELDIHTREIRVLFTDTQIPSDAEVMRWRKDAQIPPHIRAHCDAVADVCDTLARALIKEGRILRPLTLRRSAELHDLFRFVDFRPGAGPAGSTITKEQEACWNDWRTRYPNLRHEAVCAQFLRDEGFPLLGDIIEPHGLVAPNLIRDTIEKQVLFYADKRVMEDRIVPVDERFADFAKRYGNGKVTPEQEVWRAETVRIEAALFPDGPPF
jgi:tRNA threonylcarbamoyladenosine biosynthesis protein TsaE